MLHCVQLTPQRVYNHISAKKMFSLGEQGEFEVNMAVTGNLHLIRYRYCELTF